MNYSCLENKVATSDTPKLNVGMEWENSARISVHHHFDPKDLEYLFSISLSSFAGKELVFPFENC